MSRGKGFLKDYREGKLSGSVAVHAPAGLLSWLRAQRRGVRPGSR